MKRHAILAIAAMLLSTALNAVAQTLSENQRLLGYTLTDDIDVSGAYIGTAGTYPVGALLYAGQLSAYEGCNVVGIRFAVSQPIGRTRAFLYRLEDNGLVTVAEQKQRTYAGWNTVWLNGDGYTIQDGDALLYGYDYVETEAMAEAGEGALCAVGEGDEDGGCLIYGDFGQGEAFYGMTSIGNLCVQLIIDVSSLPRKDMAMTYFDPGFRYRTAGDQLEVMVAYSNTGRDSIHSCQLAFRIDDREPLLTDRSEPIACGQTVTMEQNLALDGLEPGTHRLTVGVSRIDGEAVDNMPKATQTSTFVYYTDAFQRQKTYVEVYTDPASVYVPFLNQGLAQMLKQNGDVCLVNVHRPGAALAVEEAAYLAGLYAYAYPTFTINRAYFPGEAYIAYDMNDYLTLFPTDMVAGILGDMVMQDSHNPAFATVDILPAYDAGTRRLTVEVSGDVHPQATDIFSRLALTVMLTESGVKSSQTVYNSSTGRTSTNRNYVHDHVLRQYLTAPIGDAIRVDGGRYSATYETTLPEKWTLDNMEVVAFVTKAADSVNADNVMQMDITNANCVSLADMPEITAIQTPPYSTAAAVAAPAHAPGIYSLDGQRVSTPRHGIYIVRQADGKTRKVSIR